MQLTFSLAAPPANPSLLPDFAKALMTHAETSCSPILPSLDAIAPSGWSGKTSPASCRQATDGILRPYSEGWQSAGIMRPGECLTLSTSEWTGLEGQSLRDDGVCTLSDILETGDIPQRYYLSAKACRGILRRAAKRKKALPPMLEEALKAVVSASSLSENMPTTAALLQ